MREFSIREEYYWLYSGRMEILRKIFGLFFKKHHRVLNVGCGPGGTSRCAGEFAEVFSLDYSFEALNFTHQKGSDMLIRADSLQLPVKENSFDIVLCLDVLEHIGDDRSLIGELNRAIKPDHGKLLITVPADKWQWTNRDVIFGHFRRYSRAALRSLLQDSGFDIIFLSYFNTLLFPLALVDLVMDRFRKPLAAENCYPDFPKSLNSIMHRIFSLEKHLIPFPGFHFGKSLICLARPSG